MSSVYHIRRRLPRRGGNNFYRAVRPASQAQTYCGAPVTANDIAWRDSPTPPSFFINHSLPALQCCEHCERIRSLATA